VYGGRIESKEKLASEVNKWSNAETKKCIIEWKFARQDADSKLPKHYVP